MEGAQERALEAGVNSTARNWIWQMIIGFEKRYRWVQIARGPICGGDVRLAELKSKGKGTVGG